MRRSGWVRHARDLGPHDHVCWWYDDAAEFRLRAREFLRDGLSAGLKVGYVGSGDVSGMDLDGAAEIKLLDTTYPLGAVEPDEQVRVYARATEEALAEGYKGLRIAAEATALVRGPERLAAFARYEHLVDRYMTTHPFSAMCGYDRRELGDDVVAQVSCMHAQSNSPAAGFRLHGSADAAAALAGELDMANRSLLDLALRRVELPVEDGEVVLDATDLSFMDHSSLLRLADYAAARTATLVLRTAWPGAPRLAAALGLANVRVEQP
ncbi:MEDS domain-containing protein [Actinokineospora sp. NPDC004072]